MRFNVGMAQSDRVLRAMTDDGAFRVIVARTTDTVRGAVAAQKAAGATAALFGEMLTSTVIYRETMAPTLRVQAILKGASAGHIVADSHPDGWVRGMVRPASGTEGVALGQGAVLQMMRTLPTGELHQGIVEVPENGSVSDAMTTYMHVSEQIATVIGVGCVLNGDEVTEAGGFLVQLLPEHKDAEGALAIMTQRLEGFLDVRPLLAAQDASPDALLDEILFGMPFTRLDDSEINFGCNCSPVRAIAGLSTLGREELERLVEEGETLDMSCDYCGKRYLVEPEQLRGLLATS